MEVRQGGVCGETGIRHREMGQAGHEEGEEVDTHTEFGREGVGIFEEGQVHVQGQLRLMAWGMRG